MNSIEKLYQTSLEDAVNILRDRDELIDSVVKRFGTPPLWDREPGFPTLIHIILEQQVSLASAKACFDKLNAHLTKLSPKSFLTLDDATLLQIGFSRQKTRYTRILASEIKRGTLDLHALKHASDADVFLKLTSLTGIGSWTANIYLLMALGRPDIWPSGDLALEVALQKLLELDHRPRGEEFQRLGEKWRPYRAVAARVLWHYYLSEEK